MFILHQIKWEIFEAFFFHDKNFLIEFFYFVYFEFHCQLVSYMHSTELKNTYLNMLVCCKLEGGMLLTYITHTHNYEERNENILKMSWHIIKLQTIKCLFNKYFDIPSFQLQLDILYHCFEDDKNKNLNITKLFMFSFLIFTIWYKIFSPWK